MSGVVVLGVSKFSPQLEHDNRQGRVIRRCTEQGEASEILPNSIQRCVIDSEVCPRKGSQEPNWRSAKEHSNTQ